MGPEAGPSVQNKRGDLSFLLVHLFREFSKSGSSVGALERLEEGVFVLEVESLDHGLSDGVALQKTFVLQSGNFGNVVITSFTKNNSDSCC